MNDNRPSIEIEIAIAITDAIAIVFFGLLLRRVDRDVDEIILDWNSSFGRVFFFLNRVVRTAGFNRRGVFRTFFGRWFYFP